MTERRDCSWCRRIAAVGLLLCAGYVCWLVALMFTTVWEKTA